MRPSRVPMLSAQPVTTQRCVRVYMSAQGRGVRISMCICMCDVSSLCPVYFSSPATLHLPSTTLAIPSQPTHTGRGVSRPVKIRFLQRSDQIASIAAVNIHVAGRTILCVFLGKGRVWSLCSVIKCTRHQMILQ